ncbi:MAG: DUF3089 domain-containing protein [Pseudomonadota bacterium]
MTLKKSIWIPIAVVLTVAVVLTFFGRQLAGLYLQAPSTFTALGDSSKPDPTQLSGWYSHPAKSSTAQLHPLTDSPEDKDVKKSADVFYLHPTSYFGPGEWNSPATDEEFARQGIEHMSATQASGFSACCDVYIPRYRQAHLGSFAEKNFAQGSQALEFAYQDVVRAFNQFVKERDPARPFFLAGHSQGALHGLRLLATEIEGTVLEQKLVAAYLIGYWLPPDIFQKTLTTTKLCSNASETSCIVTFDTFESTGKGKDEGVALPLWYPDGWQAKEIAKTLCVNPLTWTTGFESVDKKANLGSMAYQSEFSLGGLLANENPGYVYEELGSGETGVSGATCIEDGSLVVDPQDGTRYDNPGKGEEKSLHPFEWNMFYMNIRTNISTRLEAFYSE